jgi:hypothetical protein
MCDITLMFDVIMIILAIIIRYHIVSSLSIYFTILFDLVVFMSTYCGVVYVIYKGTTTAIFIETKAKRSLPFDCLLLPQQ